MGNNLLMSMEDYHEKYIECMILKCIVIVSYQVILTIDPSMIEKNLITRPSVSLRLLLNVFGIW